MDRQEILYMFEHKLLPLWFFEDKMNFVGFLLHEDESLFNMISSIFEEEEVDNPYSLEDFDVSAAKINDDVMMIRIGFPEPEEELLCYCVYMFFDESFEKVSYFCIERGNTESDDPPFVCSWTPDEVHQNYGHCSFEDHNDFIICANIHMEREYGLTGKDDKKWDVPYVSINLGSFFGEGEE